MEPTLDRAFISAYAWTFLKSYTKLTVSMIDGACLGRPFVSAYILTLKLCTELVRLIFTDFDFLIKSI